VRGELGATPSLLRERLASARSSRSRG
jgi:hypothetical protein